MLVAAMQRLLRKGDVLNLVPERDDASEVSPGADPTASAEAVVSTAVLEAPPIASRSPGSRTRR